MGFFSRFRSRAQSNAKMDDSSPASSSKTAILSTANLFLVLTVLHKCVTDVLSQYTRAHGEPYSAATAAILGELVKVPILVLAITGFEGGSSLGPCIREAARKAPFALALPALAYSIQN